MRGLCLAAVLVAASVLPHDAMAAEPESSRLHPVIDAGPAAHAAQAAREPLVAIEVMASLSSQTSHRGDMFPIRLVEPVLVDGKEVLAAGALGLGEVIEAKPARGGGAPGILTLGLRYLESGGRQIPLRLADPTKVGRNRMASDLKSAEKNALVSPLRTLPLNLITVFKEGGEVALPAGTRAGALLMWDEAQANAVAPSSPAMVVFFRPGTLSWAAIGCTVSEDGRKISSLGNGRWFAMEASAGVHVFRATGETRDELRMELVPGQVAYVACRMRMSALIARPTLMPSSKSEFGAQKLRMVQDDDMSSGDEKSRPLHAQEVAALTAAMQP